MTLGCDGVVKDSNGNVIGSLIQFPKIESTMEKALDGYPLLYHMGGVIDSTIEAINLKVWNELLTRNHTDYDLGI